MLLYSFLSSFKEGCAGDEQRERKKIGDAHHSWFDILLSNGELVESLKRIETIDFAMAPLL